MTIRLNEASDWRATRATGVRIPVVRTRNPGASPRIARRGAAPLLRRVAGVLACSLLASMPATLASEAASEQFGSWELTCAVAADQAPPALQSCRLTQRQSAPGSDAMLFAITVLPGAAAEPDKKRSSARKNDGDRPPDGKPLDRKGLVGIISTPAGGYLAPGMILRIDREPPFKLLYETCNASGCHAGFALEGRVLAALLRGKSAHVRIWTSRATPVEVKVPLDGFAAAREALLRRPKASRPRITPDPGKAHDPSTLRDPSATSTSAGGDAP